MAGRHRRGNHNDSLTCMKLNVAAPVLMPPLRAAVSAAVWLSRLAPNWKASPPLVPCTRIPSERGDVQALDANHWSRERVRAFKAPFKQRAASRSTVAIQRSKHARILTDIQSRSSRFLRGSRAGKLTLYTDGRHAYSCTNTTIHAPSPGLNDADFVCKNKEMPTTVKLLCWSC